MDPYYALNLLAVFALACVAALTAAGTFALALKIVDLAYGVGQDCGDDAHAPPDWQTGDPTKAGVYIVDYDGETLEECDDTTLREWHVIGSPVPVNDSDVRAWIGPIEMPPAEK